MTSNLLPCQSDCYTRAQILIFWDSRNNNIPAGFIFQLKVGLLQSLIEEGSTRITKDK